MVTTRLYTDALSGLCSKDQLELMDSIDRLRSQGISHYVSLPQIIVCGDQSSGKSSVLVSNHKILPADVLSRSYADHSSLTQEAISGVSFPIKSNLCTRFPTELILRRAQRTSCSVSIVPHASRDELERKSLARFQGTLETFDGLSDLVEDAKSAMGISAHKAAFTKDLLRVEITGPDRPHLTIVDLPGLIHSETKSQTAADVKLISDVVKEYMREPRSVILAVVSAKNDLANQVVLKMARTVDASGKRTLGECFHQQTPTLASAIFFTTSSDCNSRYSPSSQRCNYIVSRAIYSASQHSLATRQSQNKQLIIIRNYHQAGHAHFRVSERGVFCLSRQERRGRVSSRLARPQKHGLGPRRL